MSNMEFVFILVGICTATSWVFRFVDFIEGGANGNCR